MPIVKNTQTGNNYLQKINTDGDVCSTTAVRSYDRQLGSDGHSSRTVFDIPFSYDPGSHTLWVFVNGVKAEAVLAATSNKLDYLEINETSVRFCSSQLATDEIQFIVSGSYVGDESDYTYFIKINGSTPFSGNQSMGDHKLTDLADGVNSKDAVNVGQISEFVSRSELATILASYGIGN